MTTQWVSTTGLAGGLSWLRAEPRGQDLEVSARGDGETGPGTWGPSRAHVFAAGQPSAQAHAFIADFDRGHLHTQIQTYPALGLMVVHGFHLFKDGSARGGYFTREFFVPDDGMGAGLGRPEPREPDVQYWAGTRDLTPLTGTWHALAPAASQRIAMLECSADSASAESGRLRVRADGTEADALVYSDAHHLDDPPAFLATFEHDHLRVHLQARVNRGVLVVCEYGEFTDGGGRPDYFLRECYQR